MTKLSEIKEQIEEDRYEIYKKIVSRVIKGYRKQDCTNWYLFCTYYLEACKKLINSIPEDDNGKDETSYNKEKAIIVPSIYLFRHTLELVLKFIQISFKNNIGEQDINKILTEIKFENLETKKNKIDWEVIAKELKISKSKSKDFVKREYSILEELVEDYFFGLFLSNDYKNMDFILIDKQNELFKYPETYQASFQINPLNLYELSSSGIAKLKGDVKKLEKVFSMMVDVIAWSKLGGFPG